jgi:hypothetical protein
MPEVTFKKHKAADVIVVKKMRDYSKAPFFKKKAESSSSFLKKNGLPKLHKKNNR